MNKLTKQKRIQIVQLMVEGNSLRSTSRIADVSINTVTRLLEDIGHACLKFHSNTIIQLRTQRVQCDEQWSFIHTKDKNLKEAKFGKGSIWTWVAFDPDTKLVISWF